MEEETPPPLTNELGGTIPKLYGTEHVDDPIVQVKLFTPWAGWTWFVTEFDGEDRCFGLVSGHEVELGYFSLVELSALVGPGGLRIERDLHFRAKPLSQVRGELERERGEPGDLEVRENAEPYGRAPPSPIEQPGIRLIETRLATEGLASTFGAVATPSDAAAIFHRMIGEADCEHFAVLFLNGRHRVTHAQIVSRGSLQTAPVHPRDVFKAAVLANAAAIIVAHNHPTGDVQPSPDDHAVAERLEKAGKLLGVSVLDALIVGPSAEFYAKSAARSCPLPPALSRKAPERELRGVEDVCRGLLQDIDEVLERQGEEWWDETVASGRHNRAQAEQRLGLSAYQPLVAEAESRTAPGQMETG